MSDKKYAIVQISGGLGKHIALTAGLQAIKNNHPDREIIAVVAWPELFANLPMVHRVFPLGATQYFYETFVQDQDSLIFAQEVYFTTPHILKQKPMIESWCGMYGLTYNNEQPVLKINPEQKRAIRNFYEPKLEGKELLIIHSNGGLYSSERPYCWPRDLPFDVASKVAKHFKQKGMFVMQITKQASPKIPDVFVRNEPLSNTELCGLVEMSSKRLLIDSSLQHAAAAFQLPSTVTWNATSSTIFGHALHTNIQAKEKPKKSLPNSYLFDYQFDSNENEFPYEEEDLKDLYDVDRIIASLEAQTNEPKKGFG